MKLQVGPDGRIMAKVSETERAVSGSPGLYETVEMFSPLKVDKNGYLVIDTDADGVIEMKVPAYGA